MFRRSASLTLMLLVVISFILRCDLPNDPTDPVNTRVELLIRNSLWSQSNVSITDSVGNPVQIGLAMNLPVYLDSIKLSVKAEGKALFDTVYRNLSNRDKDTIWKILSFPDTGYKLVSIVSFSQFVNLVPVSAGITIVKKASILLPENHPPKWTETTLNGALNDNARYELNLSPLCADPDKDALQFAISGKTLPGDTIIGSLYVFQASSATIGKNSVELIASDPAGLKDTMELVLFVTASGSDNNPPEVTILSPDKDSSVIKAESCIVDMICSDASGIDSVYAVFNGKTTYAVLENGHYKINITGLVAGVSNIIELTVRDKSVYALKTTKTIKIKYVQSFAIAYNGNGNSSGTAPADTGKYETGTTATVKGNTGNLVKTGYVFAGWNTAADGSGAAYAEGSSLLMGTKDVTLFARWTQNATFTVSYDGNSNTSGTAPSDAGKYETGTSVTVKENTGALAKTGFTFAGWNTTADGSGTAYAAGSTFNMGAGNVTLFARWTQNATFTVTYDGNTNTSGAVPADAGKYETGSSVTVKDNTGNLVKTGFTFAGWNTAADGSGTTYAAGATFKMGTVNVTLFARWTQNPTFTVTYDANTATGTAPVDANKYEAGMVVTVLGSGTLVKKGYTFTGWNTLADGSGTARAVVTTFNMPASNVTLYAQWKLKQYNVTYNGNGNVAGNVPVDVNQYDTGASVIVSGNTGGLTKTGYVFDGWNTAENGSGTSFVAGTGTFVISSNTTLFAKWKIKTYTLSYAGNGNTGGTAPADVTLDSNALATVAANIGSLSKTGFDFNGWNTKANGSGTALVSGATFRIKSDTTLYAQWTVKKYTLTISAPVNGTVNLSGNVTVDSNATTTITATASSGFKFKCWRVTSGSAIIADTTTASTTVKLTQGDATMMAVFGCLTFAKQLNIPQYNDLSIIDAVQSEDGGYLVIGSGGLLIKLNAKGDVVNTNTLSFTDATSIEKTPTGYIVTRSSLNTIRISNVTENGTESWGYEIFKNNEEIYCYGLRTRATTDNEYVICGINNNDFLLIKSNNSGYVRWQSNFDGKGIGGNADDQLFDCQQTSDGGYIIVGNTVRRSDACVVKTNAAGVVEWREYFKEQLPYGYTNINSVNSTPDGDLILSGYSGSLTSSDGNGFILKVSISGKVKMLREYNKTWEIRTAIPVSGGYILTGTTKRLASGVQNMYTAKVNSNGDILSETTFNSDTDLWTNIGKPTKDGGCIITGAYSNWIIKTDENGKVD